MFNFDDILPVNPSMEEAPTRVALYNRRSRGASSAAMLIFGIAVTDKKGFGEN